jgi:DNA-binding transcriptional ArsR family regulator
VQAPRSVDQLARTSAMSVANASQHLQKLKRAGLVVGEREGATIRYRLADPMEAVCGRSCAAWPGRASTP